MKIINESAKSRKSIVTDGKKSRFYKDIPPFFDSVNAVFKKKGISAGDTLTLKCENSIPCALLILYLLEYEYSFLLVPKQDKKPFIPTFCRHIFSIHDHGADHELNPEKFLRVKKNEKYVGTKNNLPAKLYLRTSGSAGKPKMAVHSHGKLIKNALNCLNRLNINSDDRVAIPAPIYHMFGLGAAFLPAMAAGASIDLQQGTNLLKFLDRERAFNPNMAFMPPVLCETLVKGRRSKRPYKLTISAGDRIRKKTFEVYESMFGTLTQLYGSTEMGAISSAKPDDPFEIRKITVGNPMPNTQIDIKNPAPDSTEKTKKEGELLCFHKYGFEGYMDQDGNMTNVNDNGWFPTKDIGRITADGRIEILGRADQSVNRHGLLVFLTDVEKKVESIEGVDYVAAVSGKENSRGKEIVLYCVASPGSNITGKKIRSACFDILPKTAVPDRITLLPALPMLPNGKIDRRELKRGALE